MNKWIVILLVLLWSSFFSVGPAMATENTPNVSFTAYDGSINKTLKISMHLALWKDGVVTGGYVYTKHGEYIDLSGTLDPGGNIALSEFVSSEEDDTKKVTGYFKGRLDAPTGNIVGNWTGPDHARTYPFQLTRRKAESDAPGDFAFLSRLNADPAAVRSLYTDILDFMFSLEGNNMSLTAEFPSDRLVSLLIEYTVQGAAHSTTYLSTINFQYVDGAYHEIGINQLFSQSKGLDLLSTICIARLNEKGASMIASGEVPGNFHELLEDFTLDKDGIVLHFSPYAVGAYAEGRYEVRVKYQELQGVLDPEGPLAEFVTVDN